MRYLAPVLTRLLAAGVAVALVATGVVVLAEVAAALQGADRLIVSQATIDELARRRWDDAAVVAALAALAVAGAAAVAAGLWPRPPLLLPSSAPAVGLADSGGAAVGDGIGHPAPDVAVERRSLERVLGQELDGLEGVAGTRVRAGRRRLAVRVEVNRRLAPTDLDDQVRRVVSGQLTRSGLTLDAAVRIRRPRSAGVDNRPDRP